LPNGSLLFVNFSTENMRTNTTMKINAIKQPGGMLEPASDMDAEQMNKFKTGNVYEIEMKLPRNPHFHGKVFAFFQYCFAHWKSDREFMDEKGQFDLFRKNLTVLAGYRNEFYKIDGAVRVEAKSLSYGAMDQDEFESCYQSLIQAAMRYIFTGSDEETYNKLVGFF